MKSLRHFLVGRGEERLHPDEPVMYWYYQECIQRYLFASRFVRGQHVLDIGCGNGYGTGYIPSGGARAVVGLDLDRHAIEYAHSRGTQARYVWSDAMRLPFRRESFDVVICFEVIEHVTDGWTLLRECTRVLRNEGILICSTPNRDTHYALCMSPYHVYEYSLDDLSSALIAHYEQVAMAGQHYVNADDVEKYKMKDLAATLAGSALFYAPFGSGIKQLLAKRVMPESRRIAFRDDFQRAADPKFEVVPLDSKPGQVPATLVAVARRKRQDIEARNGRTDGPRRIDL